MRTCNRKVLGSTPVERTPSDFLFPSLPVNTYIIYSRRVKQCDKPPVGSRATVDST